jgi:putative endonuclease
MFCIYILYSESSDRYYVGYTNDVSRRLDEHNTSPHNTYTSKHRPWILKKAISIGEERGVAIRLERAIKSGKSRILIERIVHEVENAESLGLLVRVPI